MKITGKTDFHSILSSKALDPSPDSDLLRKPSSRNPPRLKSRNPGFPASRVRLKKDVGAPSGKRSRPETPLLRWMFDDREQKISVREEKSSSDLGWKCGRKVRRGGGEVVVSARKLAAGLWRLNLPEVPSNGGGRLEFPQVGVGHDGASFSGCCDSKAHGNQVKDLIQNAYSTSFLNTDGFLCKPESSFHLPNSLMEGATKWDPAHPKTSDELRQIYGHPKLLHQQERAVSLMSALEAELEQAQAHIHELEAERRSSKKKLQQFLKKINEERAEWRSREHEKIRAIINDIKSDLSRERKSHQRMEIVNSKLVNELAEAKLSAKRYMQDYEKERNARDLIEEVCDELAKEIGEDKAEVEALKRESLKLREEVEEERKMLQMAEVWREERVQMKLVDAKVALDEKYSEMNKLVADLENFLRLRSVTLDAEEIRKAELLQWTANSINIEDIKAFTYEPPNPDDIFSVFNNFQFGEPNERKIEPCAAYSPASHASKVHKCSPEATVFRKDGTRRNSNSYVDQNGDIEEDESGWETVSYAEDQGSSYSPHGSDASVNNVYQPSNASGIGVEVLENGCEETPITEISEVCSIPSRQSKKISSISRLWRACPNNGENYKIISVEGQNGRLSNGVSISPDRFLGKGGFSPSDLAGQWSSVDSGNPHVTRGMKGCIEWPRGMQKNSLKAKLLEARMESQKIQLRQVLKQKI